MKADELRSLLTRRGIEFEEREIDYGTQFRCPGGEIFNVYTTGRVSIQGDTSTDLARDVGEHAGVAAAGAVAEVPAQVEAPAVSDPSRRIFIVYGHDRGSRDSLELLLRRMGFDPIILQNLPAAGDTVIEKLERYLGEHGNVGFACVLLTPDDQGHLAGLPDQIKYRARQNVILELGMVLSRLGRQSVAILHKESVELPSDIAGLIYIPFTERVEELTTQLFRELRAAGYEPRQDAL